VSSVDAMYASVSARDADSTRRRGDPHGLAAFAKSATTEPTDSDHPVQAQDGNAYHGTDGVDEPPKRC
jgi:hypothetical protein